MIQLEHTWVMCNNIWTWNKQFFMKITNLRTALYKTTMIEFMYFFFIRKIHFLLYTSTINMYIYSIYFIFFSYTGIMYTLNSILLLKWNPTNGLSILKTFARPKNKISMCNKVDFIHYFSRWNSFLKTQVTQHILLNIENSLIPENIIMLNTICLNQYFLSHFNRLRTIYHIVVISSVILSVIFQSV